MNHIYRNLTSPKKLLMQNKSILLCFMLLLPSVSVAQMNTVFQEQFTIILEDALKRSPFGHANHFKEAAMRASEELSPALNSFIANNISSFPLSSTSAGITFDFSSGQPVIIGESLGPIFAESGKTLGKGKINFGFNYTLLNPQKIRGLPTKDIRFTFLHEDVSPNEGDYLGYNPTEGDVLDVLLGLDLNASIFAFYVTTGITNNLDLSIAIPLVNLTMKGDLKASFDSFTWASLGRALHHFGDDDSDENNKISPVLNYSNSYFESAAGVGDIALRLKYSVYNTSKLNLAFLLDARLPTGDESFFLGTGASNIRVSGIASGQVGNFQPHLNVGYDYRGQDNDSDEIEFAIGFDQKIVTGFTFALDILGEFDIQNDETIQLFPGSTTIQRSLYESFAMGVPSGLIGSSLEEIDRSNIPDDIKDHVINAALGFRYGPSDRFQLLSNILIPLNDGGLRPDYALTFGIALTL